MIVRYWASVAHMFQKRWWEICWTRKISHKKNCSFRGIFSILLVTLMHNKHKSMSSCSASCEFMWQYIVASLSFKKVAAFAQSCGQLPSVADAARTTSEARSKCDVSARTYHVLNVKWPIYVRPSMCERREWSECVPAPPKENK